MNKKLPIHSYFPHASQLVMGCMGLGGDWDACTLSAEHVKQAHEVVDAALSHGINVFDHADIYTRGKAETVFGKVLSERPELRSQMYLQSKCGIRLSDEFQVGRYDFSYQYIIDSVDGILNRLHCDYLDSLVLHRPDVLVDITEISTAFERLESEGKVRFFGVSNMRKSQVEYIQSALNKPLIVNQLEMNLTQLDWLNQYVESAQGSHFSEGLMEYSQLHHMQLQAWGCLSQGILTGRATHSQPDRIRETAVYVAELAAEYDCSREAIVLAWLCQLPVNMQPVIGTTNMARIAACAQVERVNLTRGHWYQLYVTSRGKALP